MDTFENQKDLVGKSLCCISIILLGFMIYLLFTKPFLSIDEWFTKGLVNFGFSEIIALTSLDVHPPLHYMIIKFFTSILTLLHINYNSIILVKFVSIIPYFIILFVSFTKIRKEYGWLASGLFAFSLISMVNFFTYYLTARMYSWSMLFILLSFVYASNIFKEPTIKDWVLLSLFSVLGAYTMYFGAIASICIYMMILIFIILNNRGQIKNFIISCILNVILYLPWLFILIDQLSTVHGSYWIKTPTIENIINAFATIFPSFGIILSCFFMVILFAIAIILFKIYSYRQDNNDFYIFAGVMVFIGTVTLTTIISFLFKPLLIPRILIPAAAVFWFAFSLALSKLEFNKVILAIVGLILVIGAVGIIFQVNDISGLYDDTVANQKFLDEINNDNTIVVFVSLTKFARFYEELNDTHQYYSYKLGNKTINKKYVPILNLSNDKFKFPSDVRKYNDKNIIFVADKKESGIFPKGLNVTEITRINNCVFYNITLSKN